LVILIGVRAWAAPQSVAVVDVKFGPEVSGAERSTLRAALEQALERAGYALVSETEVQLVERSAKDLFACFHKDRCRVEIGRRLNAARLVSGSFSREDGAWEVALALFDVEVGALSAQGQRVCARCSAQGFLRPVGELVDELVRKDRQRARGTLVVRTRPSGVPVQVDERPVGNSDVEVPVFAGLHTVALGETLSTTVEVQPGQRKEVDFKVPTAPVKPPEKPPEVRQPSQPAVTEKPIDAGPRRPPTWRLVLGGVGVALGAGLVGFGGKFLYDDGRGKCELVPPRRQCREVADTQAPGIGLVVTGGALVIAGGALLVHDLVVRKRGQRVALVPLIGPGVVGLSIGGGL
jgi:hypothetical protein